MNKPLNDLNVKYSSGIRWIHWITALLIIVLFSLGKYMEGLAVEDKMDLIKLHACLGTLVLLLTIARSYLYFKSPRPAHIRTGRKWNDKLAVWIHNAFYLLLFLIAFSGIGVLFFGGYTDALGSGNAELVIPRDQIKPMPVHGFSSFIMMILLVLHILGVLKHYILTKENTLKRIF